MNNILDNTNSVQSFTDLGWKCGDKVRLLQDTSYDFYRGKCGINIGEIYTLSRNGYIKDKDGSSLSGSSKGTIWERVTSKNKNKYLVFFSDRTTLMCETTEEINKLNGVNISKVYEIARELDCETVTTKVWK